MGALAVRGLALADVARARSRAEGRGPRPRRHRRPLGGGAREVQPPRGRGRLVGAPAVPRVPGRGHPAPPADGGRRAPSARVLLGPCAQGQVALEDGGGTRRGGTEHTGHEVAGRPGLGHPEAPEVREDAMQAQKARRLPCGSGAGGAVQDVAVRGLTSAGAVADHRGCGPAPGPARPGSPARGDLVPGCEARGHGPVCGEELPLPEHIPDEGRGAAGMPRCPDTAA
mmetsp:Transcript_125655/g.391267  ORF Transcript_125655/g.391267 Transcript_125655/m.391267 type:complete len:227 (-) Transcript_125655:170-850(-)